MITGDHKLTAVAIARELGLWDEGAIALTGDPRCRLVEGDFFALMRGEDRFDDAIPDRFHAILLDIDHTPRDVLHPSHSTFYTVAGLTQLSRHLTPDGIFGLWSDDPPDEDFLAALTTVFREATAQVVTFANPLTRGESTATVYVAAL